MTTTSGSLPPQSSLNEQLAQSHYENFPIATKLFPKHLRRPLFAIYAFCRHTDDLGDEAPGDRLAALAAWRADLARCVADGPGPLHPILKELHAQVIKPLAVPLSVFDRLVEANCQDQTQTRYETYEDLLRYCHYSANPVGEMVLYLMGDWTERNCLLSNQICTGLQLANFWQDVSDDWLNRQRLYIPLSDLRAFGLTEDVVRHGQMCEAWSGLMAELVGRARDLFSRGRPLEHAVKKEFQLDIALFSEGGLSILDTIERMRFNVLRHRPTVSKPRFAARALGILVAQRLSRVLGARVCNRGIAQYRTQEHLSMAAVERLFESLNPVPLQNLLGFAARFDGCENGAKERVKVQAVPQGALVGAQRACEAHVRAAAGNFYQAFRLVSTEKRNAIYALYMFCRLADDIVDDPGPGVEERAAALDALDANVAHLMEGGDPEKLPGGDVGGMGWMWVCLAEALQKYPVRAAHLRVLVDGCRDDLRVGRYRTFEGVAGYCYKVASVVGLLVMSVVGGGSGGLEPYALYGGLVVQLTNVLRDVAEDAGRDRIYLPQEDLEAFGVLEADILAGRYTEAFGEMMRFQVYRVRLLGEAASHRLPGDRASGQAMLESIRAIYERLLDQIEVSKGDVFASRPSLSGGRKLGLALLTAASLHLQTAMSHVQYAVFKNKKAFHLRG